MKNMKILALNEIGLSCSINNIIYITLSLVIISFSLSALSGCEGISMRKEMPFQEIVAIDKGIAVINSSKWYNEKLKISISVDVGSIQSKSYSDKGVCVFTGLSNLTEYNVEIKRTDVKGIIMYKPIMKKVRPVANGIEYVVLVGASIGMAWDFPGLAKRLLWGHEIELGFRCKYDFDKTEDIKELTQLPVPVSAVLIKECAAYFPRDLNQSKKLITKWVDLLRFHKIRPILCTVVPITAKNEKNNPGRLNSIISFNDFIREYATSEDITVLDLEKAVRISEANRQLRNEYADADGLHLSKIAYDEVLDQLVLPALFSK